MARFDLAIALGLVAATGSVAVAQDNGSKPAAVTKVCTPEALVGRYAIVSGEKNGMKEPAARIQDTVVTFTQDKVVVADKDKKERYSATYTLDSTKNPASITMTSRSEGSANEIARGLIKKEGDTVYLIYALPTGEVPSDFKTVEKQLMFVMKKEG